MAIGVSGGVDSLALAFLLHRHNRSLSHPIQLRPLHVCLASDGPTQGLESPARTWIENLGLDVDQVEPRLDPTDELPLDCFRCSQARRRSLLEAANERGCSHVALGHHADDVVETWLMSLMYTGHGEVMAPVRSYFGGTVTLVRPVYELQKRELIRLGRLAKVPDSALKCRRDQDSRRRRVAEALSALGRDERLVRRQLFWAAVRQFEARSILAEG